MNKKRTLVIIITVLILLGATKLAMQDHILMFSIGNSMQPTIGYISCTVDDTSPENIEIGDIVVGPNHIKHRVTDTYTVDNHTWIYRQGDNNNFQDAPIFKENVVSKALFKCMPPWTEVGSK